MLTKKQKECIQKKVPVVISEFNKGKLTSSGKKVKDKKQAVAIALSIARKNCKLPAYKPKKK